MSANTDFNPPADNGKTLQTWLHSYYDIQELQRTEAQDDAIFALTIAKLSVEAVYALPLCRLAFDPSDLVASYAWLDSAIANLIGGAK